MKKSTLIFVALLFLGLISANDELDQKPDLEGYWFAVFLPLFHEEAVEIIKSEEGYQAVKTVGNVYVPSGEIGLKIDRNFQNCKGVTAGKGFINPKFSGGCKIKSVSEDLIVAWHDKGFPDIFYRDLPTSAGSFCISDFKEKLPEEGLEKILFGMKLNLK